MPELWDYYGGERISENATIFIVRFTQRQTVNVTNYNAPGVENLIQRNGSIYILGRVAGNMEIVPLFFGLLPAVYDKELCEQCTKLSDRTCGFCARQSTNEVLGSVVMQVSLALPDCIYWNEIERLWSSKGCKVMLSQFDF